MLKYAVALTLFCFFFLVPLKNLKDDVGFLEEDKFILELEIMEKDKMIDSLKKEVFILKGEIEKGKVKPVVKPKKNRVVVKPIEIPKPTQPVINDTL